MVIFKQKRFFLSFISIILMTVFLIFISIDVKQGDAVDLSISVQNIFFWGIVVLFFQIIIIFSLYNSHRKVINDLARVSRIGDLSHPQVRKILERMGQLGKEVEHMLNYQNEIAVLRSNRISSLNSLVQSLCDGYSEPILITDVKGIILSSSAILREKMGKDSKETQIKNTNLSELRPDIPLQSVLIFLESQKLPWSDTEVKGVVCTPVLDKLNNLNFCIWEFESETFKKQFKPKQTEKISGRAIRSMAGVLGKIRNRNKET